MDNKTHSENTNIGPLIKERVADLSDTSAEKIKQASETAKQQYDKITDTVNNHADKTYKYVKTNPVKIGLLAAGIGLILGKIINIKRS